jgi:hypothetical protein
MTRVVRIWESASQNSEVENCKEEALLSAAFQMVLRVARDKFIFIELVHCCTFPFIDPESVAEEKRKRYRLLY